MKSGKITEAQCKRSVLQWLPRPGECVIQGAGIGIDYGAVKTTHGGQLVTAMAVCTLNTRESERYALRKALNKLESSGIQACAVMVNVLLPARGGEERIKRITENLTGLCSEYAVEYIGGHTELMEVLRAPVITVTAYGEGNLSQYAISRIRPEEGIVMLGYAGTEAALMLVNDKWDALLTRYPASYLQRLKMLETELSLRDAFRNLVSESVTYIHTMSTGGIFAALWEIGEGAGCGIKAEIKTIPIHQETIEVCEFFDVNPYMAFSGGSALVVTPEPKRIESVLNQMGISARMIGQTTAFNDRIVLNDDEVRYLEPPKGDDIYKIYMN